MTGIVSSNNNSRTSGIIKAGGGVSGMTSDGTDITITSGSLIIGTAGQGITFGGDPDSRAAGTTEGGRTLYDYEEGTWTAQVSDNVINNLTMDVGYKTGNYTKVGNLVHICGMFQTTSQGSATSGPIRISGLPFTIAAGNSAYSGGGVAYGGSLDITAGVSVSYYCSAGQTWMDFIKWSAETGSESSLTADEWTANGHVMIGCSYRVA